MLRTTGHIICLHCINIHCTCYVVMIYLRDSEQVIEKKKSKAEIKSDVVVNLSGKTPA